MQVLHREWCCFYVIQSTDDSAGPHFTSTSNSTLFFPTLSSNVQKYTITKSLGNDNWWMFSFFVCRIINSPRKEVGKNKKTGEFKSVIKRFLYNPELFTPANLWSLSWCFRQDRWGLNLQADSCELLSATSHQSCRDFAFTMVKKSFKPHVFDRAR